MNIVQIPPLVDKGRLHEACVDFLYESLKAHRKLLETSEPLITSTAERYACGFPLPPFQRAFKWSREQEIAFIQSLFVGIPVGTYTLNRCDWERDGHAMPFSGWLLDGQQRLTTLEHYFDNVFPVFGGYFSDLTPPQRRRFLNKKFTYYETDLTDESALRALYNLLAFGGIAHTEQERA